MRCLKIILPVAVIIVFVIGVFGLQGNRRELMEEIESQEALIRDYDDWVLALEDSLDLARQQVVAANEELEAARQEVEKVRQEENTAYQELERVTTQAGYGKEETWPREGDGQYDGKPIEVNNLPVSFYVVTEKILLENETQSLCKMYFERPVFYPNPSEEESDGVREALKKINASLEKECQAFFEGRDYFFDFQSDEIVESYRNLGSMYFNTANISEIYYDEAGYLFLIWGDDWYAGGVYNGGLRPVCFSVHTGERVYLPEVYLRTWRRNG